MSNIEVDDKGDGSIRSAFMRLDGEDITLSNWDYRQQPPDTANGRSIFDIQGENVTFRDCKFEGAYHPMIEARNGADYAFYNCRFPHNNHGTSSPYVIRHNSTPIERTIFRDCDLSAYSPLVGTGSVQDIQEFVLDNTRGFPDPGGPVTAMDFDTNTGSNLSLSVSSLGNLQACELLIEIQGNGSNATSDVDIQFNGQTSGYQYNVMSSGALTHETTNDAAFTYQVWGANTERDRIDVTGGNSQTFVSQISGTADNRNKLLSGDLTTGGGPIDSVTITTSFNAAGKLYVIEKGMPE